MFTILYILLQWTWGVIQNIVGAVMFLIYIGKKHYLFHGSVVTVWKVNGPSTGMGMFIFISENCARNNDAPEDKQTTFEKTLVHEYGHTVQSAILGPFYLLVIGLPSAYWCSGKRPVSYRKREHRSYYSFYPERWANRLGERFSGEESMGQAFID